MSGIYAFYPPLVSGGGGGGGVTTIGPIDGNGASANGASISGSDLYMQSASATVPGLVNDSAQTFAGNKTFTSAITLSSFTQGSVLFAGVGGLVSQNNAEFFWDNTALGLRIGTNAALNASALETVSALQSNTAPGTVNYTVYGRSTLTSDSAMTASQHAFGAQVTRVITTTAPTDTDQMVGISVNSPAFTIPTAQTLLNTATNGYVGINLSFSNTITGGGALNFDQWTGMSINSNATNTGTRKTSLHFNGTLSGATNNAYLADNAAYTGNYFINSTSSNPSLLTGALTVNNTVTVSSSVTGVSNVFGTPTNNLTIANSANSGALLGANGGSGIFIIENQATANSALMFFGPTNKLFIISQTSTEFALTASPSASDTGLVYLSTTSTVTIYNNTGSTGLYQITCLGV